MSKSDISTEIIKVRACSEEINPDTNNPTIENCPFVHTTLYNTHFSEINLSDCFCSITGYAINVPNGEMPLSCPLRTTKFEIVKE